MKNPFVWISLITIAALVILFFANPILPIFGGLLPTQALVLMVLIPFIFGLLLGFFLGLRRGNHKKVVPISPRL